MIFVRTEGKMYAVLDATKQYATEESGRLWGLGPMFYCVNNRGDACYIFPKTTKCIFYRGPVAELLRFIFPELDETHTEDVNLHVPAELWADKLERVRA